MTFSFRNDSYIFIFEDDFLPEISFRPQKMGTKLKIITFLQNAESESKFESMVHMRKHYVRIYGICAPMFTF